MIETELIKHFNRRSFLIGGIKIAALTYLIIKLFKLQIIDYKKYKSQSDKNSLRLKIIIPPRGIIYDNQGRVLATSAKKYSAYLIVEEVIKSGRVSLTQVLKLLTKELSLSNEEVENILSNIETQKKFLPITIKQDLNWEQMARLESNNMLLPGVFVEEESVRSYPLKNVACHTIGYVSKADKEELSSRDLFLEKIPNFKIGKSGIEKKYNDILRGTPGEVYQLVNAVGRTMNSVEEEEKKAIQGQNIQLTIDSRLQTYASSIVTEKSGSAIVMDIHTGEVLCLLSFPEFNLSEFEGIITSKKFYQNLSSNEYKPLINKAISGTYAPGSTWKIITALSALENNTIDPNKKIFCDGYMSYGKNHKYYCWRDKTGHGPQNMSQALENSCDIYFYKLAQMVGIEKLSKTARKFGFGEITSLDLGHEKQGIVPDSVWKAKKIGEPWYESDTIMAGIGQSYILTTPIQLCQMMARIANGKYAVTPSIVKTSKPKKFEKMDINPAHLEVIHQGLYGVINSPTGTAPLSAFNYKGMKLAGKTGTTQVRRISTSERESGKLSQSAHQYNLRNHALFTGFAPFDNPRFAVAVVIEHGRSGSSTAAPFGSKLLKKALELYL